MKRSLKELIAYAIEATDGTKGSVKDFLFDEIKWKIRYVEADLGWSIFPGKKVLIPRNLLNTPRWEEKNFPIKLSKEEVKDCPKATEHQPISRTDEEMLNKYYNLDNYWVTYENQSEVNGSTKREVCIPSRYLSENPDTFLRSFKEVEGYTIQSLDEKFGHIEDIIVDGDNWQILYLVVDTSNWLPWSKKVLIDIAHIKDISHYKKEVFIGLSTDVIKSAPEYDHTAPVNEVYERKLYDYYGNTVES